jgi:hypothetical protein
MGHARQRRLKTTGKANLKTLQRQSGAARNFCGTLVNASANGYLSDPAARSRSPHEIFTSTA